MTTKISDAMSEYTKTLAETSKILNGGTKFDNNKPRFDLFPPNALRKIVEVFTFGAKKYDDRNWEKGITYGRLFGALMRHMWAWWSGEDKDPESGKSHLAHAGCCIAMLLEFEGSDRDDLDDRPRNL